MLSFAFRADLLILGLDALELYAGAAVLLLQTFVALHDGIHIVQLGQELREIGGVEDQRQNIIGAVLLHGADAGAVFPALLLLRGLRPLQLQRFLRQDLVVHGEFLRHELKRLFGRRILLFQRRLLFQDAGLLLLHGFQARLRFVHAGGQLVLLCLQRVDLRLRYRMGGRDHAQDQRQDHHNGHDDRQYGYCSLSIHSESPKYAKPSDNCGWH